MPREMKDSGIAWIGKIPDSWNIGRIGHLYTERKEKVSDTDFSPLSVTMKGILPQLSTAAKTDAHDDRKLVRKGDFAINSRSDRRGSCGISSYDGSVSLINTILSPRSEMNPGYYNWLFHSTMFSDEFYKWGHGIVDDLWTTNWQDMKKISVPLPPIQDQVKIASFLDTECARIDAVMEQTHASIEEYKKLKQSVITQAITKGIRPNRPMKDSGVDWIGEIPVEWDCTLLKRHCRFQTGSTPSTTNEQWFNGDLDWFTPSDFSDNYYLVNSTRKLSLLAKEEGVATIIPQNTVMIIGIGGTAGKIGFTTQECSCNQQITAISVDSYLYSKYLMYWMIANTKRLKDTALYTTLPIINNQTIGEYSLLVPESIEEQIKISEYLDSKVEEIEKQIKKKEELLSEMETYKKSLIYEYVTGKKEVH
ncbi:MAG: restriction endonuclease subunit S [Clostridia bacterium]|nr:restriction endonuclease subunit S [Clostridia bacterium]